MTRGAPAALIVALLTLAACGRPPLRVSTAGQAVVIDMQSLGEYPSDVARVRLTDASTGRVVWEVAGRDEPQLGRIELTAGANPTAVADVRHGKYDVVVPAGAATFTLEAGKRYLIEAWRKDAANRTRVRSELLLPAGGN